MFEVTNRPLAGMSSTFQQWVPAKNGGSTAVKNVVSANKLEDVNTAIRISKAQQAKKTAITNARSKKRIKEFAIVGASALAVGMIAGKIKPKKRKK